jgi:hypothetical protein
MKCLHANIVWLLSIFCQFFKLSIWISCFRVLFGCNSTFDHPAYLNSGKKWCGSIYLLSFGGNYSIKIYQKKCVGLKKIQSWYHHILYLKSTNCRMMKFFKFLISTIFSILYALLLISLQDFKHALIFWQNVEESCTFQKIYGLQKVKLKIKWPGRFEKTQI